MEQLGDVKRAQKQARKTRLKEVRIRKKLATFYKEKSINEKNEKRSLVVIILRLVKQQQRHTKKEKTGRKTVSPPMEPPLFRIWDFLLKKNMKKCKRKLTC